MKRIIRVIAYICLFPLFLGACQPAIPQDALLLSPTALADRQLQTRVFETNDRVAMLKASAQVLQDLGFSIDEHEVKLGILVGSKQRDASSAGQIAGAVFLAILTGANTPVDDKQLIRVSMVIRPLEKFSMDSNEENGKKEDEVLESEVRITFQRIVINTAKQVTVAEQVKDVEVYADFFEQLSKSVFLEAHKI